MTILPIFVAFIENMNFKNVYAIYTRFPIVDSFGPFKVAMILKFFLEKNYSIYFFEFHMFTFTRFLIK